MKNNIYNAIIRNLFGKLLAMTFLTAIMATASFAQSQTAAVYHKTTNGHSGYFYVYPTEYQIQLNTSGLVTVVRQPCVTASDSSFTCGATTYNNGRQVYYGEFKMFPNHLDFGMRYTHRWNVNQWETEYSDGWTFYYVK